MINHMWLELEDTEQRALFQHHHQCTKSNLYLILVGGYAVTGLCVAINYHALCTQHASLLNARPANPFYYFPLFPQLDIPFVSAIFELSHGVWGDVGQDLMFRADLVVQSLMNNDLYVIGMTVGLLCFLSGLIMSHHVGNPTRPLSSAAVQLRHDGPTLLQTRFINGVSKEEDKSAAKLRVVSIISYILRLLLIFLRLYYVGVTILVWNSSNLSIVGAQDTQYIQGTLHPGHQSWTIGSFVSIISLECLQRLQS